MAWSIEFTPTAEKQLKKIDRAWQKKILDYLEDDVGKLKNPRVRGKRLTGDKKNLWRYRVGNYRVICQIVEYHFLIVVVIIGHRKEVYNVK